MVTSNNKSKNSKHNGDNKYIHTPHDKLFFAAMKNHNIARDAMQSYLPNYAKLYLNYVIEAFPS